MSITDSEDTQKKVSNIIGELKTDLFHSCCMNPDCDGYHPGEDENDKKAVDKAIKTIVILLEEMVHETTRREQEVYQHIDKLRHAVDVAHWRSKCGNCNFDKLTGKESTCPRCKQHFDYVTTEYIGEEKLAQAVFPHLSLLSYLPQCTISKLKKEMNS